MNEDDARDAAQDTIRRMEDAANEADQEKDWAEMEGRKPDPQPVPAPPSLIVRETRYRWVSKDEGVGPLLQVRYDGLAQILDGVMGWSDRTLAQAACAIAEHLLERGVREKGKDLFCELYRIAGDPLPF